MRQVFTIVMMLNMAAEADSSGRRDVNGNKRTVSSPSSSASFSASSSFSLSSSSAKLSGGMANSNVPVTKTVQVKTKWGVRKWCRKTWTRLMDNRHGNSKVHPSDEEQGPGPPSARSSVDLTPTLMTVFDAYSTEDENNVNSDSSRIDISSPSLTSSTSSSTRPSPTSKFTKHISPPRNGEKQAVKTVNMDNIKSKNGIFHTVPEGPVLNLTNDAKKRPLSISSTSSSTSSTSSLPRQQRKKLAGMASALDGGDTASPAGGLRPGNMYTGPEAHMDTQNEEEEEEESMNHDATVTNSDGESNIDLSRSETENSSLAMGTGGRSASHSPQSLHGGRPSSDTPDLSLVYIDKVVTEIIETERTYVRDLDEIIEGYLAYIEQTPDLNLTPDDTEALFGNIEQICQFNRSLLLDLEECEKDPVQVAECFVNKNEGFVIYTEYCTNYPRSVEVITRCMRCAELADAFRQRQAILQHGLPLGSYLLKPVQRILKYHLLLQNILNNFDDDRAGYDIIKRALSSMTNMAQHINEMKRKHEHAVRVQEIQSLLYGWEGEDLTTYGELVLEDVFRMCGAKAYRRVFLFDKGVLICKKKEDGLLVVKAAIKCSNLMLIESVPREPLSFHVIPFDSPKTQYTLQARNLEQKRRWCSEMKRLILENYNVVIPEKAKELVMMLGKSKEEERLNNSGQDSVDSSRRQHQAPEYLEKRRCRRKSATIIADFSLLKQQKRKARRKSDVTMSPKSSPPTPRRERIASDKQPIDSKVQDSPPSVILRDHSLRPKKERPLSRSLESLVDLDGCRSGDTSARQSFVDTDAGATSYDDACPRAKRISQILNEEGLTPQARSSSQSWQHKTSLVNMSPVKRAESFRIATELNRVDSRTLEESLKSKYNSGVSRYLSDSTESVEMENRDLSDLQDGCNSATGNATGNDTTNPYVNVLYSSKSQDPYLNNNTSNSIVKKCISNLKAGEHNNNGSTLQVIMNQYAKSTDSLDNERIVTKTASYSESDASPAKERTKINRRAIAARERFFSDPAQFLEGQSVNGSKNSLQQQPSCHVSANNTANPTNSQTATPKRVVSPTRLKTLSKGLESLFKPRNNSNLTKEDPWIKRQDSAPGALVHSTQADFHPASRGLCRSNSTSSINDSRETIAQQQRKGHRRMPSDTLIFANRNALYHSPRFNKRTLCSRYATPPRDLEPSQDELLSREMLRTVSRYATPPRSLMDPANMDNDQATDLSDWTSTPGHRPLGAYSSPVERKLKGANFESGRLTQSATTSPNRRPHFGAYASSDGSHLSPVSLNDLDRYIISDNTSHVASMLGASAGSSPSCHVVNMAASTSPTSPSGDSLVDTLKHAVINITSRLTGRHARLQSDSSTGRSPHQHSLDSSDDVFDVEMNKRQSKERSSVRQKFVYSLARAYSDRIKKRPRPFDKTLTTPKEIIEKETIAKQLTCLLKDNKPGSTSLGARISSTLKPIELGTYTLQRQRPPRPQKDQKLKIDDTESVSSSEHSSHETTPEAHLANTHFKLPFSDLKENCENGVRSNHDSGCLDTLPKDLSENGQNYDDDREYDSDGFYERKFVEDLEFSLEDELFRDSAIYSDDGATMEAENTLQKLSIRETIRRLEIKQRLSQCQKTIIKPREKSHGIKEIVKSLESKTSFVKDSKEAAEEVEQIKLKPVKDRTRELVECARSTRIRSESLSLSHDNSFSDQEDEGQTTPDREVLASRKGWVKEVISKLQQEN